MTLVLLGFVFAGLFSPGPNVIMLSTSGARFGVVATMPHLAGVVVGVGITASVTGLGLGLAVTSLSWLKTALGIVSALWILWMAKGLWTSQPVQVSGAGRPFTFIEAVLFQWVNPKVWAVAFAASAYVSDLAPLHQAITLGVTFSGVNLFVCLFWTKAGSLLSHFLADPATWRLFMWTMACALVVFSALVFL